MRNRNEEKNLTKRRVTNQRTFEVTISKDAEHHLSYFIKQELGYYNSLVEQLTPRLRSFPQDFLSIKDREKRLWESCAENAVDPNKMILHRTEEWPENLRALEWLVKEPDGTSKITPAHANIIKAASSPARVHPMVRKAMAAEMLRYMIGQADVLYAGLQTEGLRAPMQMLQPHTTDTKRHLQVPASLVKVEHDEAQGISSIRVPYAKDPLQVKGFDLSEIPFKMLIIRAPHQFNTAGQWMVDFKDSQGYLITLTDHNERRRR